MTRALATSQTGLPGPGQDVFPEQGKEIGRRLGLTGEAAVLTWSQSKDAGGSTVSNWTLGSLVDARIDAIGGSGARMPGGQISESSTHIITFYPFVSVTTKDRVRMLSRTWAITAVREVTNKLVTRVEAKEIST
jgi:hypothetical protein